MYSISHWPATVQQQAVCIRPTVGLRPLCTTTRSTVWPQSTIGLAVTAHGLGAHVRSGTQRFANLATSQSIGERRVQRQLQEVQRDAQATFRVQLLSRVPRHSGGSHDESVCASITTNATTSPQRTQLSPTARQSAAPTAAHALCQSSGLQKAPSASWLRGRTEQSAGGSLVPKLPHVQRSMSRALSTRPLDIWRRWVRLLRWSTAKMSMPFSRHSPLCKGMND